MRSAIKIAKAMREALKPDGVEVSQANGEAAGQDVLHYHLHLYPRWKDGTVPGIDEASKDQLCQKLKSALARI